MAIRRLVLAVFVVALLVMAASLANPGFAPSAHAQTGVCPENPDPVDLADPAINVDQPSEGDEVASPLRVSGEARVFEANVSIVLLDSEGNELANTFTTAEAGAPEMAPFATDVEFTVEESQPGCLQVFEASAQDGSPTNVVQVEVSLVIDGAATPVPPSTGSGVVDPGASGNVWTPLAILLGALVVFTVTTVTFTRLRA